MLRHEASLNSTLAIRVINQASLYKKQASQKKSQKNSTQKIKKHIKKSHIKLKPN